MGIFNKKKKSTATAVKVAPPLQQQQTTQHQAGQGMPTAQVTAVRPAPANAPPQQRPSANQGVPVQRSPPPVPVPAPAPAPSPVSSAPAAPEQTRKITTTPKEPIPEADSNLDASIQNLSVGNERLATTEITRELVKKFIADIWNRGEIDDIPKICHPSLRFNGHIGMDRVGHEGFARMVSSVREAISDYHCEVHSMVCENNKAFCRLRFTGKHTGNLLGYSATGKTVAWMGASEFTCKNGKILKVWELGDVKSLEDQLKS
jgi:predicted ester cyclase